MSRVNQGYHQRDTAASKQVRSQVKSNEGRCSTKPVSVPKKVLAPAHPSLPGGSSRGQLKKAAGWERTSPLTACHGQRPKLSFADTDGVTLAAQRSTQGSKPPIWGARETLAAVFAATATLAGGPPPSSTRTPLPLAYVASAMTVSSS